MGSQPKQKCLVPRLGSMVARLKLKGIDGGSHKRWSMWLNSRLREEPFPDLTCSKETAGRTRKRERTVSNPEAVTGAAWLSSARVVRCRVKSHNERNPYPELQPAMGTLGGLPVSNRRKVGMTSSPHGLYVWGCTRATMAWTKGREPARG